MIWMLLGLAYLFRYPTWLACVCLAVGLRVLAITVDLSMFSMFHS